MEYTARNDYDSYTRYRSATVTVAQRLALRSQTETVALLMLVSAIWGYVLFAVLRAMV